MPIDKKKHVIVGGVTINLVAEERVFWIKAMKQIKTDSPFEEQIVKRTIARLFRRGVHRYPLYPDQECPHCERSFAYKVFRRHKVVCGKREREKSYVIDAEIFERI